MQYKKGTKFVVCTHSELKAKGWKLTSRTVKGRMEGEYLSDDFECGGVIQWRMIDEFQGETLTVRWYSSVYIRWYSVEENNYLWPVEIFLETETNTEFFHTCEEGMTPIDGWFICKICGDNLREIK